MGVYLGWVFSFLSIDLKCEKGIAQLGEKNGRPQVQGVRISNQEKRDDISGKARSSERTVPNGEDLSGFFTKGIRNRERQRGIT
jgi:hypothetical protein